MLNMTSALGRARSMTRYQLNQDVDRDGTIDIALQATVSIGPAGAQEYEFELAESSTYGGTYAVRETVNSATGRVAFKANSQKYYKMRCRAISWTGTPGDWSSYTTAVQPSGAIGAPAAPSSVTHGTAPLGFSVWWDVPPELDYSYSEIWVGTSGAATAYLRSTSSNFNTVFYGIAASPYVWVRHVNTSGLKSAWTRTSTVVTALPIDSGDMAENAVITSRLANDAVTRAKLSAGAAGAIDHNNSGTSMGSVNAGAATKTLLLLSFKMTSNTAGVTINLGSYSTTVDFVSGQQMTITTSETGGGSFSASKSGGSISGCQITAFAIN